MVRLQAAHVPEQRGHGEQHDQAIHQPRPGDGGAIPLRLLAATGIVKVTPRAKGTRITQQGDKWTVLMVALPPLTCQDGAERLLGVEGAGAVRSFEDGRYGLEAQQSRGGGSSGIRTRVLALRGR
jgi:hypothetical protein